MTRHWIIVVTHLALALGSGVATAQDSAGEAQVRGAIVKVLGEHLVIDAKEPNRNMKIDAAADVKVKIDGQESDLSQLQPGMEVRIVRNDDGNASEVVAWKAAKQAAGEVNGTIRRSAAADGGTRLMIESDAGDIYSYDIRKDVKVSLNGESVAPDRLTSGMSATIDLDGDGAAQQVVADRQATDRRHLPPDEIPGIKPANTSRQYDMASGRFSRYAGTFEGTFAYSRTLGYGYGQESEDSAYVRPLYRHPRQPWTLNVLPREKAFQRAAQQPGQPDLYREAFLTNDGQGDSYPNAPDEIPGYNRLYRADSSSRYLPLTDRCQQKFKFELGEQEGR